MDRSDLKQLETRIDRALSRIESAIGDGSSAEATPVDTKLVEENRVQAEEIANLRGKLGQLQEARRRDADDVTAILADLRPLLER